jgi:hypothetical protein
MPASGAHAAPAATLPITSFYQIVTDTAHGHLFISQEGRPVPARPIHEKS